MSKFKLSYDPIGYKYPNLVLNIDSNNYLSYNDVDIDIYGDVTTAIVVDNCSKFYILQCDFSDKL